MIVKDRNKIISWPGLGTLTSTTWGTEPLKLGLRSETGVRGEF